MHYNSWFGSLEPNKSLAFRNLLFWLGMIIHSYLEAHIFNTTVWKDSDQKTDNFFIFKIQSACRWGIYRKEYCSYFISDIALWSILGSMGIWLFNETVTGTIKEEAAHRGTGVIAYSQLHRSLMSLLTKPKRWNLQLLSENYLWCRKVHF